VLKDWVEFTIRNFYHPELIKIVFLHEINPESNGFYAKEDFINSPGCVP